MSTNILTGGCAGEVTVNIPQRASPSSETVMTNQWLINDKRMETSDMVYNPEVNYEILKSGLVHNC